MTSQEIDGPQIDPIAVEIRKLHLAPGDHLVLTFPATQPNPAALEGLRKHLCSLLPAGSKVVLLHGVPTDLTVVTPTTTGGTFVEHPPKPKFRQFL